MGSLGGWEIVILLVVVVALFGAKRLPDMARSIGQSARVFKGEMKGLREDEGPGAPQQQQPRAAELPPASDSYTGQQYTGPQATGQQYTGPVNGAGNPQPSEPVRRDADR